VMWRCEGCGFRLDLPEGVAPPMWHTLDRPMERPPDEIPVCPNIKWIKPSIKGLDKRYYSGMRLTFLAARE